MRLMQISVVLAVFGCSFGSEDVSRERVQSQEPSLSPVSLDGTNLALQTEFEQFKLRYNRQYSSPLEERRRFQNFVRSHRIIEKLRASEMGTAEYGFNKMSDLSEAEFRTFFANLNSKKLEKEFAGMEQAEFRSKRVEAPANFDWRDHGAVTPVKKQGECGSAWAFSTVALLESMNLIKHGNSSLLTTFSEQQLIDCDDKSPGCDGESPTSPITALDYVFRVGGLESDKTYPYEGIKGRCRAKNASSVVQVKEIRTLPSCNEDTMMNYIASTGPTINAINANYEFQFYKSGILLPYYCSANNDKMNHFVTVVGYGYDSRLREAFWVGKNSWGVDWGEEGYFRIRGNSNACGIANFVYAGDVK